MTLVDFSFVIQEGETEIEYVYVEERVRRKSLCKKKKELKNKVVVFLRSKHISCVGTGTSWPTVLAAEYSSSF
ncbi:4585_t:CDS:2 [Racocetra persica]|uniref:4585_t:CDS:1 n=1 Tax=Racocetra persica TaxID=160502 RepID=A0ACA9KK95_9GLOM|nr:4585_t:CDS:2 [Racocetra persica]